MKIEPKDLMILKLYINKVHTEQLLKDYLKSGLSINRYRWDVLHNSGADAWVCGVLYKYLNDTHITTALKSLIKG